jgi:fatty acid desaturase
MSEVTATDAQSSGVVFDERQLKALARRSDGPGLRHLGLWISMLIGSGFLLHLSLGGAAVVPAMVLFGTVLTIPAYSLSHECSHGTAFRTRWLNESVLWLTSLIYMEGPMMRRYAHARHHSYTWMQGKDAQMPFHTPLTPKGWLLEISGIGQYLYDAEHMVRNALGRFHPDVVDFTPPSELPKLKWEARAMLSTYAAGATATALSGALWPLVYLLVPRLVGGVAMQLFTIIQHAEMEENTPDLRRSTRSFTTNRGARFLYANMNHHIEHHLYPRVPFHALPKLNEALREQLPEPSRGLFVTNLEVLRAVARRTFGKRRGLTGERAL